MMPRRVMASIRSTSPLARARPGSPASRRWSLARQMIRSPAEASAPSAIRIGAAGVDEAEVDQVVADPGGEFAAAGPVRGHQQHVASGQVAGEVGAGGLVHGLVGRGAADAAVLVVLIQRGGVPLAEAEGGGAFPGGGEPDGFGELDVAEPVREQRHGAAAFDRGELFLVPGQDELAPVAGGVFGDGGQVGDGDHGAFVGQDQRAGRDPAVLDGRREAGWCSRLDLDAGVARARWWRSGRWRCRIPGRPRPGRGRPGRGSCRCRPGR